MEIFLEFENKLGCETDPVGFRFCSILFRALCLFPNFCSHLIASLLLPFILVPCLVLSLRSTFSFFDRSLAHQHERDVPMRKNIARAIESGITLFCAAWFSVLAPKCLTSLFYRVKFRHLCFHLLFLYRIYALPLFSVSHLSKISTCQCAYWCFLNSGINVISQFSIFCIFLVSRISKFQFSRFLAKLKLRISKILHFNKFAVFEEFRKARGSKRIEKSWRTRKLRSVKKCACVTGSASFCSLCSLSLSRSRVRFLCVALSSVVLLSFVALLSVILCSLLSAVAQKRFATPLLPPLPLTKKTLL